MPGENPVEPSLGSGTSDQRNDQEETIEAEDQKIDETLGEYVNEMLTFKSRPKRPRNRKVDTRRKEMQRKDYSAG